MRKILVPILSLIILIMFESCTPKIPTSEEIKLTWEIISNEYSERPQAKAKFTVENNSQFTLKANHWTLFFNQAPRTPLHTEGNARVSHISGDWFKLEPTKGFSLKPGESIEIIYECSDWLIKESDAAIGPYFVFYDKKGNETEIVTVSDYTILPFTKPEHLNRHKNDYEPIPTAKWQYEHNVNLFEISKNELLPIIPSPVSYKATGNKILFEEPVEFLYQDGLEKEARFFADFMGKLLGMDYPIKSATAPKTNSLYLGFDDISVKGISEEAYNLEIKKDNSIVIKGSDPAGVFYGLQSLISLLPVEIFRGEQVPIALDEVVIKDAPRFEYRGVHLDVGRNFQTKESVKKVIDILSFYKGNYLLFYITEDEGWRLDIEELPELARVGGQRGHTTKEANAMHPSYGSGPVAYAEETHGSGYYTREDFIEILQYAQKRHVKVIPEVNFPGHSRAAIKAMEARYEKFMAEGNEEKANEFRLIDPNETSKYLSAQWYSDNIVNVALESTYKFYETVIDDIIEMYDEAEVELEYFHTGGDEVPEGSWSESPLCAELMKQRPEYKDPKNLQAYFFKHAVEILERKNLKIAGWEEVALLKDESGKYISNPEFADKNVYPYVWNNLDNNSDLAYRMANAGYPIIMCNVSNFYFDLAYNKDPREPGLYWAGFVNTRDAWQVAPFDVFKTTTHTSMGHEIDLDKEYAGLERLKPEAKNNIIGVEAHLWSETIKGSEMLQHYLLPKLMGFAESAWAKERAWETIADKTAREELMDKDWNIFANTLAQKESPRLKNLFGGFNYRVPTPGAIVKDGKLHANSTYPGLTIRYTTDGSKPTKNSMVYKEPVLVSEKVILKAFDAAGKESKTIEVE
ncbi:carbohydate-binding domain-containing protein [Draconibacterium sp.]|nr:carbohydate-binding domain-containing protein [Draconibacterium sp.]